MIIYCMDCEEETPHKFIAVNPDNEQSLYECECCNERQEIEEN